MSGPRARTRARRAALQALYQWQVTGDPPRGIARQFLAERGLRHADAAYFQDLVENVPAHAAALDELLAPLLDRPVRQLDPVTRALLRMGAFELQHRPDVPYAVVIDEAVALAHVFGAEQSHRYVNGVLDRLARRLRPQHPERRRAREVEGGA